MMNMNTSVMVEVCPVCGEANSVRSKLVLIDGAWVPGPGKEAVEKYFASMRIDDVHSEVLREYPLEQFLDGFYCDRCNKGFISEIGLCKDRRRYSSWLS